jgi:alpha-tubulin suppressor-like RCC1 family protein
MGAALSFVDLGRGRSPVAVACGSFFSCVLLNGGAVKCFGANSDGQLGQGDTISRGGAVGEMGDALPVVDFGLADGLPVSVTAIATGFAHACALTQSLDVRVCCWGLNEFGQLGLGDSESRGDEPWEMGANLTCADLGYVRLLRCRC